MDLSLHNPYVLLIVIFIGVFIIVEWRLHDSTDRKIKENNEKIDAVLKAKDEVLKLIMNRMTDEIFDTRETLEDRLVILENKSEETNKSV